MKPGFMTVGLTTVVVAELGGHDLDIGTPQDTRIAATVSDSQSAIHQLSQTPQTNHGSHIENLPQGLQNSAEHHSALGHIPASGSTEDQSRPGSLPCACLSDLIRVVQQLDDDEFHITTLPLDQALQLQKWLVFQCCKPLDCSSCIGLASVHTVLLCICDRLTEMFECIHRRLRIGAISLYPRHTDHAEAGTPSGALTSRESQSTSSTPAHSLLDAAVGAGPRPAQLFDSISGQASNISRCNPMMFSDEFRNQYSDEEQVHMIGVLLKLQVKNFRQLLARVEETRQVAANQARHLKVKAMVLRLLKASADIDSAMQQILRHVSGTSSI